MFRPFKDLEKYFYGEISFDELIDSCISEMRGTKNDIFIL